MKRNIGKILIAMTFVLVIPLTMIVTGFNLPKQFRDSYYGVIAENYHELIQAKRKKIIFIGNSAVAFGVRPDLVEKELSGYNAVNFGVYGAVGTKFMLDLSKANIGEGDIIIIMPELFRQTCSLYFSAKDVWRAVDSDFRMLFYIPKENYESMIGNFFAFSAEKYKYFSGNTSPSAEGVYNREAFLNKDGTYAGYMTYDRAYNEMLGGYDPVNQPVISANVFGDGFINYLNEYNDYASQRGATVFFGFSPINSLSVSEEKGDPDEFYDYLYKKLNFEILGHPLKYMMDFHWFYDNNVHMNSCGAIVYTNTLVEDLKLALEIYDKPNMIELPDMPEIPMKDFPTGDNSDAQYFTYERVTSVSGDYIRLTALTEEGRNKAELTLPYSYNGIPVKEFMPEVFQNNDVISRIILPETISVIYEDSFLGAEKLSALYFKHDAIRDIAVTEDFLHGADKCVIYVKSTVNTADGCTGGWTFYGDRIKTY